MSSRGVRAQGTDGSDFEHRETVASRYKTSLNYKSHLKKATGVFLVIWMVIGLKLVNELIERYEVVIPDLAELAIPRPLAWEYVWILSIVPAVLGLLSLSHNNIYYLNAAFYGLLLAGIAPILGACVYFAPRFIAYCSTHRAKETELFLGQPIVLLWACFFAVTLQVHLAQVYFAYRLRKAWDKTTKKAS